MSSSDELILVTGATGAQGGATARALLGQGRSIRILTRTPDSEAAKVLQSRGAEVVRGDFEDPASVKAALTGVSGVFSVQLVARPGTDNERKHGFLLVESAREAGVRHFVHTSVRAAGRHTSFPRWGTGYWYEKYWTDKWDVEEAVRGAGFPCWTVLKPAFIMDNFIPPKVDYMFPHLREGKIATALHADTRLQLIAADDIGRLACAAFQQPDRFNGGNIELAVEELTMSDVAGVLSRVLDRNIVAVELTPEEAVERGLYPGWVRSQEWSNEVPYGPDIPGLSEYGISMETFEAWAWRHKSEFRIDPCPWAIG